jgi:hypothetical protein
MPIPTPKSKKQSKKEFISSCMGDNTMNTDYPDNKQRAAICYSQWDEKKSKASIVVSNDNEDEIIYEPEDE